MIRPLLAVFCLCVLSRAQAPASPDQIYTYDPKVVHVPVPIQSPEAEMPDQARRQQLNGMCALSLVVDKQGLPQNVRVVRCTDPMFAENSLHAVKKYRFHPATTVAGNIPVLFSTHIEVTYMFSRNRDAIPLPRPRIKLDFVLPSEPPPSEPDSTGTYTLSHAFDPPNSLPRLQRWVGVGFRHSAFTLEDGTGCTAALTLDDIGRPTDVQITKCDDHILEEPVLRSLWNSQFSPAMLNGKTVPVRASVRLACEGFDPPSAP